MIRPRPLVSLWLACVASACTDGSAPMGSGRAVPLDVTPSFQVDPVLFPSAAIDRIRLVASDVASTVQVGSADVQVSPTASQWTLSLGITLGDEPSVDVLVDVELLAGDAVQWSGRLGPITVRAGVVSPAQSVSLHRGPLDNLDVVALDVPEAPAWIAVGGTALLVANPTLLPGSSATPSVFWASTNTAVATVSPEGLVATLTGVSAGATEIVVVAGPISVTLDLEVRADVPPSSKTWIGGDPGGPTLWHNSSNWSPAGVPGVDDDVRIPADASVTLSAAAAVRSLMLDRAATLDLVDFTLTVSGDLDAQRGAILNGSTRVAGAGSVLRGYVGSLEIASNRALSGQLTVDGDVTLADADLDLNGQVLAVTGGLYVAGPSAHFIMTLPGGHANVSGPVLFDGGDHSNLLSEGVLVAMDAFTVSDRSATGFAASGNHTVYFGSDGSQGVSFSIPGTSQQRLANVVVASTLPTTFLTDAAVTGGVTVTGSWVVPLGMNVGILGALTLYAGSTSLIDGAVTASGGCVNFGGQILGQGSHPCPPPPSADRTWLGGATSGSPSDWSNPDNWSPAGVPTASETVFIPAATNAPVLSSDVAVAGLIVGAGGLLDLNGLTLTVSGDLVAEGGIVNGLVDVTGTGQQLHGVVENLRVSGDRVLTSYLYISQNLDVRAQLTVGAQYVQVIGDLTVQSQSGRLVMGHASSYVYVAGSALFDGADASGSFTLGSLQVLGDFTVGQSSSPLAFRSTGTVVLLAGSTDQTVSFTNPAPSFQAFQDLYVSNSGGRILLASSVVVEGTFSSSASVLARANRQSTALLRVYGDTGMLDVTFDGLPVSIESTAAPFDLVLQSLTFTQMPTAETQLYIAVPGGGASSPLLLESPVFDTAPGANAYYLHVVNTTQQGLQLVVQVANPTPQSVQQGQTLTEGGPTSLVWPYP